MAVNFNDPTCGFFQKEVVEFLNKQILRNGVSPQFYLMQMCESWGDLEKKLRDILTDSAVSGAIKEACAWRTLALAVRMAEKQKREDTRKVRKLQDQLHEQKLFTNVLVGMVNKLRKTREKEKEKAQTQLQENLVLLRGVEAERNTLRSELLKVLGTRSQRQEGAVGDSWDQQAQTSGAAAEAETAGEGEREGEGEAEAVADAAAVSAVRNPTPDWRGKHSHYKKFSQRRFKREAAFSGSAGRNPRRHAGDWDCDRCHSVNFSWRKKCYKCKKFPYAEEGEGSYPGRNVSEF
ncbi:testis-expressed protein 13C-1-like [Panthera tigris]|uniref:testis-expressed protein 13C-1-like n=1 Tax=Panthera tigris TaxID=9694 RepID=UPI001C6F70D8|nr:testis-expressed protein 13C-1-like [Panthera tigris]